MSFFLFGDSSYSILAWFAWLLLNIVSGLSQSSLTPFLSSLTQICIHSFTYYIYTAFFSVFLQNFHRFLLFVSSFPSLFLFPLTSFPSTISSHFISSFVSPSLFWVLKFLSLWLHGKRWLYWIFLNCDKVTCTVFNCTLKYEKRMFLVCKFCCYFPTFFFFFWLNQYYPPDFCCFCWLVLVFFIVLSKNPYICPESKLHYEFLCMLILA